MGSLSKENMQNVSLFVAQTIILILQIIPRTVRAHY